MLIIVRVISYIFNMTDKIRCFGVPNCLDIVVETFNIFLTKKTAQFSFVSYCVFYYCFVNFFVMQFIAKLLRETSRGPRRILSPALLGLKCFKEVKIDK